MFSLHFQETFRKATQRGVLLVGVMKLDDKEPSSMADVPGLQWPKDKANYYNHLMGIAGSLPGLAWVAILGKDCEVDFVLHWLSMYFKLTSNGVNMPIFFRKSMNAI